MFYTALKNEVLDYKFKVNENVLAITFDYCSNILLPKLPVQELYYMRQLTVNIFSVHDVKQNKAFCFIHHEGQAKKGPDEVCSFLWEYLQNIPDKITKLYLYSDSCLEQNKNHTFARFLLALTDRKSFKKIINFFPVKGHSYLTCDRDFSIIKRKLRKHDRIFSVYQLTEFYYYK